MNGFKLASAILRSTWLVNDAWADNNISLAQMILDGNNITDESKKFVANLDNRLTSYQYRDGWKNASKGSFAYYNINGPILHYGYCDNGTHELHQSFNEAEINQNIAGHFFLMDTPGGQADGILEFAETIKNSSKPVVAFVNGGMIASAGVWIACAADYIFASSALCEVGSIGAFSTLIDASERDKKEGVKRITIRAKQSTDKNTVFELAKTGDKNALAELEERVSVLAGCFIDTVKSNRKDKLTNEEWNSGRLYFADEAVSMGLIDGICTMDQAIDKLSSINKPKNKKSNMKIFNNVAALADQDQVTQELLDLANADLTAAGITHVTLVEQSVIDEGARVTAELATAQTAVSTANSTIAAQVTALLEKDQKIAALEGVIANRAKVDTGTATVVGDAATETAEIDNDESIKVAKHNQIADTSFFGGK